MKATGIIRRIDDLGRIVIPKEIRKTMHIRESNPLEIFTEKDGSIILKNTLQSEKWAAMPSNVLNLSHHSFLIQSAFVTRIL